MSSWFPLHSRIVGSLTPYTQNSSTWDVMNDHVMRELKNSCKQHPWSRTDKAEAWREIALHHRHRHRRGGEFIGIGLHIEKLQKVLPWLVYAGAKVVQLYCTSSWESLEPLHAVDAGYGEAELRDSTQPRRSTNENSPTSATCRSILGKGRCRKLYLFRL